MICAHAGLSKYGEVWRRRNSDLIKLRGVSQFYIKRSTLPSVYKRWASQYPEAMKWLGMLTGLWMAGILLALTGSQAYGEIPAGNEIRKQDFNFAHQLGYLYSRIDNAYFDPPGTWSLETGVLGHYTRNMPLVENPDWRERLLMQIPFTLRWSPAERIVLQANSDFVGEFPYRNRHSVGGNSPRFRAKIRLLEEGDVAPALAFTVGVKFSSAKPYNIWDGNHNYRDSNGLAGIGTGLADYFLILHASRALAGSTWVHSHVGLAPVGDPTAYGRGSSQADQILYGLSLERHFNTHWGARAEIAGMAGALRTTSLDHYSVARLEFTRFLQARRIVLNLERGLTWTSDDWVAGLLARFDFGGGAAR
jgi:hypothetical protein